MSRKVEISHPDKILFPDLGWTKKEVVDFYLDISEYLLPHLKEHPLVVQRFPDGIGKKGFYQQEVPDYYPDWIHTLKVKRKEKGMQDMLEIHTKTALKYVVNQDGICFHTWLSRIDAIKKPEYLIFDLDPSGKDFSLVKKLALEIKKHIEEYGATAFVMTTGSKGLHVVVPIKPEKEFDAVRSTAKSIAEKVVEKNKKSATLEIRKNKRGGKIFLDYLRNSFGQTTINPYSLRASENAPIAAPLDWDELSNKKLASQSFTAKNIFRRLSQKKDPWKEIAKHRCSIGILNN